MIIVFPKLGKQEEYNMDNYNGNTYARQDTDMSVGSWIGTMILSAIPIVGFICLIVWAVSSSPEKRSRKNWAIAQFILTLIVVAFTILVYAITGGAFLAYLQN